MSIYISIWTNIDGFSDDRTDVLNSSPNGVAKEASRCNEKWSTYGVVGIKNGSKEVGGYIDSGSK